MKEEEPEDGGEGMEENQPEEAEGQEPKTQEEENKEEGGNGAEVKEEEEKEPGEETEEEKEDRDAGNKEEPAVPVDKGDHPKVWMEIQRGRWRGCKLRNCSHKECLLFNSGTHRMRKKVRMRSTLTQLRGRSTAQTVRLEKTTFRVTRRWRWQGRRRRETRPKR